MNPQVPYGQMGAFYPLDYGPHQLKTDTFEKSRDKLIKRTRNDPVISSICNELTPSSRLLDLGCGSGAFLSDIAAITGCKVWGVDFSDNAARTAKQNYGIDVFVGSILESPFQDNFFDVITAWSCLEHVNDPAASLRKLYDLLKPGGSCVISTPNFDSFNARLFREKWYHLDCPRHLYIYSPRTLTALLQKSGFSIQKVVYDKSSKGTLGSLQYLFYGDNYNLTHRNRLRRSLLLKTIVSPFSRIAALLKKSDVIVVLARKKTSFE